MFKSFLRYKYKTILILISATAAIASIFLITALGNGIISMYASMLKTDGDIIVTQKGVADTFFSDINRSLLSPISNIEGVATAQGVIVGAGSIESIPIAGIYGITDNRMSNYNIINGHAPKGTEVMIGNSIAKLLHNPKHISLMGKIFQVSGIYKSDIGFENGGVVIPIRQAEMIFHKSASFLLVSLDEITQDTNTIIKAIQNLTPNIEVKSTTEFINNYNQFKIIRISSDVIASISFFMGFLAIVSLMSMMINDRRYEFGIKRAMGISKFVIIRDVILEVLVLTVISFFIAYGLSLGLLNILEHIDKFQGYLSGDIDNKLFIKLLIGSSFMAMLGAAIPAFIASRIDPIILINKGQ